MIIRFQLFDDYFDYLFINYLMIILIFDFDYLIIIRIELFELFDNYLMII